MSGHADNRGVAQLKCGNLRMGVFVGKAVFLLVFAWSALCSFETLDSERLRESVQCALKVKETRQSILKVINADTKHSSQFKGNI